MPTSEELKYFVALRDVIAGKMGKWRWGDRWYDPDPECIGADTGMVKPGQLIDFSDPENGMDELVRLPLPIDPENPERGLWGMIHGPREMILLKDNNGNICVAVRHRGEFFSAASPTLALLKALAWQEGIEVTP